MSVSYRSIICARAWTGEKWFLDPRSCAGSYVPQRKLCRTYLLCGYQATILTLGHVEKIEQGVRHSSVLLIKNGTAIAI